jgi:hypothetical protein
MDRVTPPEFTDWIDALVGSFVLVGGSFLTMLLFGIVAYW